MRNKSEKSHYDKQISDRPDAAAASPPWRELILRFIRHGRRFLFPVRASSQIGIGAIPNGQGVTFRVWAPNATNVQVAGSFNRWSKERHPLAREGNGYWSVNITAAKPGDEYKFVIQNESTQMIRTDPYARDVVKESNNGVICRTASRTQGSPPPWMPKWNELVIYELHVGTFSASAHDARGQFRGVIEKLPYLQELGINAIELMPISEFAGDYSWGYNPAHPFAVTRTYGGSEAFRELVDAAHNHGLAVIVDVVYNHFGPEDLSLWQFDGWQENGKGGIYFYNDWRSTTPWADTRPDYGRTEVRQYIRDNALMWLEEFQVDGLRWDATAWIRNVYGHDSDPESDIGEGWGFMRWVNDEINLRQPWTISIAEDLRGNPWLTKSTADGGAGFDAQWDDRFVHPIRQAVIVTNDEQRDMNAVAAAIQANYEGDVFDRVIYTESHDEVANGKARVPEEITPGAANSLFSRQRAALGAALVFTSPGIPMLFQGQEFLESGWFEDTRSLDWQKAQDNAGLVNLYRDLIHLRRNRDGRTRGLSGQNTEILYLDDEQKLLTFHRWELGGAGDDVLVIANFANKVQQELAIPFPHPGRWHLRFNSALPNYGLAAAEDQSSELTVEENLAEITLPPYGILIFSQNPA
jgi:1,4-alpha-glucan branching enzyme